MQLKREHLRLCSTISTSTLPLTQTSQEHQLQSRKKYRIGSAMQVIDAVLFIYFLTISIAIPLVDAQVCLPSYIFPDFLVQLKNWFALQLGNYLISEKPHFYYVGIAWLEVLFAWPISIASIYGVAAGKSWLSTTCFMYGVYFFTALVAILAELMGSEKASKKLLVFYYIFLGFAVLAIVRGLLPHSQNSNAIGTQPARVMEKRE